MRSSWLIRLTNWSFIRSVGARLGHVGADEVPAVVHAAVVAAGGDRHRDRARPAVGGHVRPVPHVAAVLLGGVHERGQSRAGRVVVHEFLGQVEVDDRPPADDVGARQAEHLLGTGVPHPDDAVEVGADDRLLGDRVDHAGHRLRAGGEHAGGEVELVGARLHLREQRGPLRLQPCDVAGLAAGQCAPRDTPIRDTAGPISRNWTTPEPVPAPVRARIPLTSSTRPTASPAGDGVTRPSAGSSPRPQGSGNGGCRDAGRHAGAPAVSSRIWRTSAATEKGLGR